jgi:hypothetical protein
VPGEIEEKPLSRPTHVASNCDASGLLADPPMVHALCTLQILSAFWSKRGPLLRQEVRDSTENLSYLTQIKTFARSNAASDQAQSP